MIRVLEESLVNKIAAGEVIVRPASAVKELVENAIDAGATRIAVEVTNGTRDIKVSDDGCGMDRKDAELSLVRHATSKITEFENLWTLSTRGFRGEALASIAAVSRLQILTRPRGAVAGTRITSEGPGEPRIESAGAPDGTEVRIRELFYNTPARLKFMKNPSSELNQILTIVTRQALILPKIGFTVSSDKAKLIDTPPDQRWDERVAMLLGSQIMENLLDVDAERHGIRIRGFVLKPAVTRKDRRHQFFFVNSRPVTTKSLAFVLQDAYKGIIMVQRYPICVLDIQLPTGEVDINVHPTKEEVRFRNESLVNGVVHRVVHGRLQAANLLPEISFDAPVTETIGGRPFVQSELLGALPSSSGSSRIPVDFSVFTSGLRTPEFQSPLPPSASASLERQAAGVAAADREFEAAQDAATQQIDQVPEPEGVGCSVRPLNSSLRQLQETAEDEARAAALFQGGHFPEPLGQIARCYILAQAGNDLLMIDQHAAHERLLYLQFSGARREAPTQPLLIPVSVDVPASAAPYMERLLPLFEQLGMHVEPFGGQTFLVQTIPADIRNFDAAGVISDLIDDFESLGKVEQVEILRDRIITRMACRAAIKAGQSLHHDEMRALIRDIATARLGFTCPHGRPTMMMLTRDQLDRQFKRKL